MSILPADLEASLGQLVDIVKPIVAHIEASTPTTKDHYGDYMSAITMLSDKFGKCEGELRLKLQLSLGLVMKRAGANNNGVMSALRVMGAL